MFSSHSDEDLNQLNSDSEEDSSERENKVCSSSQCEDVGTAAIMATLFAGFTTLAGGISNMVVTADNQGHPLNGTSFGPVFGRGAALGAGVGLLPPLVYLGIKATSKLISYCRKQLAHLNNNEETVYSAINEPESTCEKFNHWFNLFSRSERLNSDDEIEATALIEAGPKVSDESSDSGVFIDDPWAKETTANGPC